MTTHTITKAEVLTALRTEPLAAGAWVANWPKPDETTCRVCAVGALLRAGGFDDDTMREVADDVVYEADGMVWDDREDTVRRLLANGALLDALSVMYEAADGEFGEVRARAEAIAFVEQHFPDMLTFEHRGDTWELT